MYIPKQLWGKVLSYGGILYGTFTPGPDSGNICGEVMEPEKLIIQIQDSLLAEFLYHWVQYDKPCSLLFQKPKTEGLVAIKLLVDTGEIANFVIETQQAIGYKIHYVK